MEKIKINFEYSSGARRAVFSRASLTGSWNAEGKYSDVWQVTPMSAGLDECGCQAFTAEVELDAAEAGKTFYWGVILDAPGRPELWGIASESGPPDQPRLDRSFVLAAGGSAENYRLVPGRCLGANKHYRTEQDGQVKAGIRFAVWAPHAQKVELVTAAPQANGYIRDDGQGVDKAFAMEQGAGGIWNTAAEAPEFADHGAWLDRPYMFRVTREDGSVVLRTDLLSRCQLGSGGKDPAKEDWNGQLTDLDCTKGCSVVQDPDTVCRPFGPLGEGETAEREDWRDFWQGEYNSLRPVPTRLEDMVIYEMHIGGLWAGPGQEGSPAAPGSFREAMDMLDYLDDLGVNAVELLPMSTFEGPAGWGYGTSHYYAVKYETPGRDEFKHFVRACHRRGLAVLVDVVYNHYTPANDRVQWMYDSARHDHNSWFFYTGKDEDYPNMPDGGYCDNMSTGYLPNMGSETVRQALIGSAAAFALEYHVDGFRVDLTQALHSFNVRHADGQAVPEANEAGIRFMREWARTLRLFKPNLILLAEDHSGWNLLARPQRLDGVGFDASWWSEWYHQLVGDSDQDDSKARLLRNAGYGTNRPLRMNMFGGMMLASPGRVVYNESHDESGNSHNSARNIEVAVNGLLFDNTRFWAEARCRVAAGLTVLSGGTPMFFMGEEVCAAKPYRHDDFLANRENYEELRAGSGAGMFRFYRDLVRLRLDSPALRSPNIEILKVHNQDRIIAWRRWLGDEEYLILASLSNKQFTEGYGISHRSLRGKAWKEVFNSDAQVYGGGNFGNQGKLESREGALKLGIPACGLLVLGVQA